MGGIFIKAAFPRHLVVKEHLSVVAGENDKGIVQKPVFPERPKDQPNLVINMGALGKIRPSCQIDLPRGVVPCRGGHLPHDKAVVYPIVLQRFAQADIPVHLHVIPQGH